MVEQLIHKYPKDYETSIDFEKRGYGYLNDCSPAVFWEWKGTKIETLSQDRTDWIIKKCADTDKEVVVYG